MKRYFLMAWLLVGAGILSAQDTLTVMSYNLLNYPDLNSNRYNDLKVIIEYTQPDIFLCSEFTAGSGVSLLLNNAFNVAPVNYYAASTFVDGPDTDNMLFYNTNKVTLVSQNQIPTTLRDITHYKVYTCENTDTVWYDLFSVHLKASSGWANAQDRLAECTALTDYIATLPTNTNIIVGGDFNFYGASPSVEPAWNQLTITCAQPLKDPINMVGEWHANSVYKDIHTQSTRSNANPGCCGGSTGGMDDRFDFLLVNNNLMDGWAGAQYINGSYIAIGQDGNHFNQALIEGPANTSVPSNVNTALFNMSDHLPVLMKIYTCDITLGAEDEMSEDDIRIGSFSDGNIYIYMHVESEGVVRIEMVDIRGAVLFSDQVITHPGDNQYTIPVSSMVSGMYILRLMGEEGSIQKKFIK